MTDKVEDKPKMSAFDKRVAEDNAKVAHEAHARREDLLSNGGRIQVRIAEPDGDGGIAMNLTAEENEKVGKVLLDILKGRKI